VGPCRRGQTGHCQQRLQRTKRRSKNRDRKRETVGARHHKVANQRKDFHHKQARALVERYDLLVVEDLNIDNMLRKAKPVPDPDNLGQYLADGARAKSGLSRSISDVGWGRFVLVLRAKAAEAGRIWIEVDPGIPATAVKPVGAQHRRTAHPRGISLHRTRSPTHAGRRTRRTQRPTGWTGPSRASRVKRTDGFKPSEMSQRACNIL
jgi:Probable transposase